MINHGQIEPIEVRECREHADDDQLYQCDHQRFKDGQKWSTIVNLSIPKWLKMNSCLWGKAFVFSYRDKEIENEDSEKRGYGEGGKEKRG